ncbi:hypothetical protein [Pedobacter sp. UBA4863]|uniref:hypothetical protein n=1 Tax=Pedobacter sp. UBA4863 TaxID=1947060 RepID=UPI0025CBAC98|nr:hypothetical protein [Pedobacter sp. UBA4863]
MLKSFLNTCFLFFLLGTIADTKAQTILTPNNLNYLTKAQDTLAEYSNFDRETKDDAELLESNASFIKKLVSVLKTPHSFQFDFDSLVNVSVLKAPDQTFRIFTWFLPFKNGTYKYYGTIQMATKDGSLKLLPLNDASEDLDDNLITNQKRWYGARYYEIVFLTYPGQKPYYILLGWKGNNEKTTKKVIETLSFEKNEAVFGRNVFQMPKNNPVRNRIVFEYNKQNTMTLTFNKQANMIVFDHLAPYEANMVGNFEFYASDLSFDGYTLNYQKLYLKENIQLKNETSAMDEFYSTPRKATTLFQKGKH